MICLVAYRSAAPERHRGNALILILRGLLHIVPAHAYTRTMLSPARSHHDTNCFFLYIYRSQGVSLDWFLLAVEERVKVSAACCGNSICIGFPYVKHLHPRFSPSCRAFPPRVTSLHFFCSLFGFAGFFFVSALGKVGKFMVRTQWHAWFMFTTWIDASTSIWTLLLSLLGSDAGRDDPARALGISHGVYDDARVNELEVRTIDRAETHTLWISPDCPCALAASGENATKELEISNKPSSFSRYWAATAYLAEKVGRKRQLSCVVGFLGLLHRRGWAATVL
jgi:hypothetical protein